MELLTKMPALAVARIALLPGTFNPPTNAHLALASAALRHVDHVLLVLPRNLPHKKWEGAPPEARRQMLERVADPEAGIGAAVSDGGLMAEVAEEARVWFPSAEVFVICGRDAAERIIAWDYGQPGQIERMLERFRLLVAPRQGAYQPPAHLAHAVKALDPGAEWEACSATSVRDAVQSGRAEAWRALVPRQIHDLVERLYARRGV